MTQEVKPQKRISWMLFVGIATAIGAGMFCCVLAYGLVSGLILNPDAPTPTLTPTYLPTFAPDTATISPLEETETPRSAVPIKYTIIRQWQPNNLPDALGLEILLESEPSPQELIDFLSDLGAHNDLVVIHVYSSMEAYNDSERTSQAYKEGYIACYNKDLTGLEPDSGRNEVRWFQEVGAYSSLYGTVVQINAGELAASETPSN